MTASLRPPPMAPVRGCEHAPFIVAHDPAEGVAGIEPVTLGPELVFCRKKLRCPAGGMDFLHECHSDKAAWEPLDAANGVRNCRRREWIIAPRVQDNHFNVPPRPSPHIGVKPDTFSPHLSFYRPPCHDSVALLQLSRDFQLTAQPDTTRSSSGRHPAGEPEARRRDIARICKSAAASFCVGGDADLSSAPPPCARAGERGVCPRANVFWWTTYSHTHMTDGLSVTSTSHRRNPIYVMR